MSKGEVHTTCIVPGRAHNFISNLEARATNHEQKVPTCIAARAHQVWTWGESGALSIGDIITLILKINLNEIMKYAGVYV